MTTFNTKLARALGKAIGLKSWKYVGPHVSRKHFLLMAQKFGGCCQNNAPPLPPLRPGSEDVWTKLWQRQRRQPRGAVPSRLLCGPKRATA